MLISIKCVTWLVDVELLVRDTCAPAVPATKTAPPPRGCQEHEQWQGLTTAVGGCPRPSGNSTTDYHNRKSTKSFPVSLKPGTHATYATYHVTNSSHVIGHYLRCLRQIRTCCISLVTLNELVRRIIPLFALFHRIRFRPITSYVIE